MFSDRWKFDDEWEKWENDQVKIDFVDYERRLEERIGFPKIR